MKTLYKQTRSTNPGNLWKSFLAGRGDDARKGLIEYYWPLVKRLAQRMHTRLTKAVEIDDLISAGTLGLMKAINAFDPCRGVAFESYSSIRIHGAMIDELRTSDWVPRLTRQRASKVEKAMQKLRSRLNRKPTEDELAENMHLPLCEFRKVQADAHVKGLVSLNQDVHFDNCGESTSFLHIHEDKHAPNPVRCALRAEIVDTVTHGLKRAERLILQMYYFEEMTMKEIGAALEMSESRVSQLHSELLPRLRRRLGKRRSELFSSN